MLTPAQAEAAIAARLTALGSEYCPLERAGGRVLREAILADLDQPPFDRVAMDGIAIAHAEFARGRRSFRIAGVVAAGAPPATLATPETCLEVMTGAVLPPGTDAVVPIEDIALQHGVAIIADRVHVAAFANVHRQGTDARAGAQLLAAGACLRGPEVAIAASAGRTSLLVSREPRVAVISTGDELVPPGTRPAAWQVRRSNAYGVAAALRQHGFGQPTDDHVMDDPVRIRAALARHLATHDVLVLSGGVSAGRFDHVPAVLAELGVEQVFHKVAQRPGKPLWFGIRPDGPIVFALPGNPVSTLVCLIRYVLPALVRLVGAIPPGPVFAPLAAAWHQRHALTTFLPVDRVDGADRSGALAPHPTHGSGDFAALAGTSGFVELAPESRWEPGSLAPFYTW
ncbi:MAG TPA: molybdopterin molybdotransferase MoeA [Steroidobacteraceae bacterium]|nr:molybdopterin molybdotransferase MoeA [Steroidobacteraceae bacterium]